MKHILLLAVMCFADLAEYLEELDTKGDEKKTK